MADGRGRLEWAQTSSILAFIANANRDPKKHRRPYSPAEFNPYLSRRAGRKQPISVDRLANEMMAIASAVKKKGKR